MDHAFDRFGDYAVGADGGDVLLPAVQEDGAGDARGVRFREMVHHLLGHGREASERDLGLYGLDGEAELSGSGVAGQGAELLAKLLLGGEVEIAHQDGGTFFLGGGTDRADDFAHAYCGFFGAYQVMALEQRIDHRLEKLFLDLPLHLLDNDGFQHAPRGPSLCLTQDLLRIVMREVGDEGQENGAIDVDCFGKSVTCGWKKLHEQLVQRKRSSVRR